MQLRLDKRGIAESPTGVLGLAREQHQQPRERDRDRDGEPDDLRALEHADDGQEVAPADREDRQEDVVGRVFPRFRHHAADQEQAHEPRAERRADVGPVVRLHLAAELVVAADDGHAREARGLGRVPHLAAKVPLLVTFHELADGRGVEPAAAAEVIVPVAVAHVVGAVALAPHVRALVEEEGGDDAERDEELDREDAHDLAHEAVADDHLDVGELLLLLRGQKRGLRLAVSALEALRLHSSILASLYLYDARRLLLLLLLLLLDRDCFRSREGREVTLVRV